MARHSKYPEQFRREAVQMALSTDASSASVARRLGVNETTLRNWVQAHLAEEARAADPLATNVHRGRLRSSLLSRPLHDRARRVFALIKSQERRRGVVARRRFKSLKHTDRPGLRGLLMVRKPSSAVMPGAALPRSQRHDLRVISNSGRRGAGLSHA